MTPGAILRLAYAGYGVDDIRVLSGWPYRDIAAVLRAWRALWPLARLAERRAEGAA